MKLQISTNAVSVLKLARQNLFIYKGGRSTASCALSFSREANITDTVHSWNHKFPQHAVSMLTGQNLLAYENEIEKKKTTKKENLQISQGNV